MSDIDLPGLLPVVVGIVLAAVTASFLVGSLPLGRLIAYRPAALLLDVAKILAPGALVWWLLGAVPPRPIMAAGMVAAALLGHGIWRWVGFSGVKGVALSVCVVALTAALLFVGILRT